MSKKAKFFFWGTAVLISTALYIMPGMIQSSIPSVYYVTPNQKIYENVVTCTGTVQSARIYTLFSESALVAEQVQVAVGDRVEEGAVLATVDQDRTTKLNLSPLYFLQELTGSTLTQQADNIDWNALAASYGLSATITNGMGESSQDIEKILQDLGVLSQTDVVGAFAASVNGSIHAPVSGIVTDVSIRPNVPLSAGRAMVTISDDTSYKVVAQVNESDIGMIQTGDTAVIRGVGFGSRSYTGEVVRISPTARKTLSGTSTETVVDVELLINNPDQQLKSGFTAKVEITGGEDYHLLTVPYEAIRQDENNDEYVYVYEDGKIQKALVTTGKELTNEVQILSGIDQDQIVVYNPSDIAREGMVIQIKGRADVN